MERQPWVKLPSDWPAALASAAELTPGELLDVLDEISRPRSEEKKVSSSCLADIEARMRAPEAEAAALRRFPEDDFAEGTIIRFDLPVEVKSKPYPSESEVKLLTYAALKVAGKWWITRHYLTDERHNRGGINYDTLRQIMTRAENARVFTGDGEPLAGSAEDGKQ